MENRRQKAREKQEAREAEVAKGLGLAMYEAQRVLRAENEKLQASCRMIAEDGKRIQELSESLLVGQASKRLHDIREDHRRRWMPWRSVTVVQVPTGGDPGQQEQFSGGALLGSAQQQQQQLEQFERGPIGPAAEAPSPPPYHPSSFLLRRHQAACRTQTLQVQVNAASQLSGLLRENELEDMGEEREKKQFEERRSSLLAGLAGDGSEPLALS